ncbi:MAG TPA: chemotaxis protein CheD [Isosphaeraceae bacterium]|nr:chemotaxis protein CheD [Isosphaeraceae bacterium]
MSGVIPIDLGVVRLSRDAEVELVAYSLGSCVAVCVWDPAGPLGGMAHVVLPTGRDGGAASGRYADQAVPLLAGLLERAGGCPRRAVWKIAGGANVLRAATLPPIGERNIAAVRAALRAQGLDIAAEDTGGSTGRTVRLRVRDGRVRIRLTTGEERDL